ncbi:MAG: SUMF1/EgtB/PvdO family nonheme iron enzyme [Deltaproteobacteria bacterium]|nr:SUMF1/EgtB/PvdO family nonheme iron enzyme [Deltaproteobacteria bacterium]
MADLAAALGEWHWLGAVAVALVVAVAGCQSSASIDGLVFACTRNSDCRAGHVCVAKVCRAPGSLGDTGALGDSAADGAGSDLLGDSSADGEVAAQLDTAGDSAGDGLGDAPGDGLADAAETAADAGTDVSEDADPAEAGPPDAIEDQGADTEDAATDATAADGDAVDAQADAAEVGDQGPQPPKCPGDPGCACAGDGECSTGKCVDYGDEKLCAASCKATPCDAEHTCSDGAIAGQPLCLPRLVALCSPCKVDADCSANGLTGHCVDMGAGGSYCGANCQGSDCPAGYSCAQAKGVGGESITQCVPTAGTCSCSAWAIAKKATTACAKSTSAGTCKGERSCEVAGLSACSAQVAEAELCDGADNDCDSQTDEDFSLPSKTGPLSVGAACKAIGACGFGSVECASGGKSVLCSSAPGGSASAAKAEKCNGLDDDCDGLTDEDFTFKGLFIGDPCTGQGACGSGAVECGSDATAVCSSNPGGSADASIAEICNNKDDDCDGETDEVCVDADKDGFCTGSVAVTAACKVCQAAGDCDDNSAAVNPGTADQCNAVDDDCDGQTDNPKGQSGILSQPCYDGTLGTAGVGKCKAGSQQCTAGKWGGCSGQVVPGSELCGSGGDEDCDGATDEDCAVTIAPGSYHVGCMPQWASCASDSQPDFPYPLQGFSIEASEVSVAAYKVCVDAKVCEAPGTASGCNWGVSGREDHPVNCVNLQQAQSYCSWRYPGSGQLPSEIEWQAAGQPGPCAALGVMPPQPCMVSGITPYSNGTAQADCSNANLASCGGTTVPAAGTLYAPKQMAHLVGNVAEWTRTSWTTYPVQPNSQEPTTGQQRVVMGGSYATPANQAYSWSRQSVSATTSLPTIGFRCRTK